MVFSKAFFTAVIFLCISVLHAVPASSGADIKTAVDKAVLPFMQRNCIQGVAVGIVTPDKCYVFNYGYADADAKTPVTDFTLFDVGSISKTFTATLTTLAEAQGKLSLSDRLSAYMPELEGSAIGSATLLQLGTQTSCLPFRAPDEVADEAALMGYLSTWKPEYPLGETRIYSNIGIGLLGLAAAKSLNADYRDAMRELVIKPMGLKHTYLDVPESEMVNYAMGCDGGGHPCRMPKGLLWVQAYGIRTTAPDMVLYIKANLGMTDLCDELRAAIKSTHKGYYRIGTMTQGLVWDEFAYPDLKALTDGNSEKMVRDANPARKLVPPASPKGDILICKTGATDGFGACVAFIPSKKIGMVLLANHANPMVDRVEVVNDILERVVSSTNAGCNPPAQSTGK